MKKHENVQDVLYALTSTVSINAFLAGKDIKEEWIGTKLYLDLLVMLFGDLGKNHATLHRPEPFQASDQMTYHNLVWQWKKAQPSAAGSAKTLLFDCHGDVVPPGCDQDPRGRIENDRVYGRGAADPYGTLACLLVALRDFDIEDSAWDEILIAIPDGEELGLHGAKQLCNWLNQNQIVPTSIVVCEPTGTIPVVRHRGRIGIRYEFHGSAGHLGNPNPDRCAIRMAIRVADELLSIAEQLCPKGIELNAEIPSLAIGMVGGGTGYNVQAQHAWISIDRRLALHEDVDEVVAEFTRLPSRFLSEDDFSVTVDEASPSLVADADSGIARTVAEISGQSATDAFYMSSVNHFG